MCPRGIALSNMHLLCAGYAPVATVGAAVGVASALLHVNPADPMHAFYNAARSIDTSGPFLRLLPGVEWPLLGSIPLYVRDCYNGCFNGVLCSFEGLEFSGRVARKFIVCGNPGIGKSAFGLYLLIHALRQGRFVVYDAAKLALGYVCGPSGIWSFDHAHLGHLTILNDPRTVFISDSLTPPVVRAFTVLITSPRRDRYWEYYKQGDAAMLYFPVFSWEEIQASHATCFPALPIDGVMGRYARWGGIPRYVLEKTDPAVQGLLDQAVKEVKPSLLLKALGEASDAVPTVSQRLLHIKCRGELENLPSSSFSFYGFGRSELGSAYICDMVWSEVNRVNDMKMRQFLEGTDTEVGSSLSVLRGHVFERLALQTMAAGGTFLVRNLSTGEVQGVEFPAATVREFVTISGLAPDDTVQWQPRSRSFCALDAILAGRRLANATISTTHPISLTSSPSRPGLEAVVSALQLGPEASIPFYWLVPESVFASFVSRQAFTLGGRKLDGAPDKHPIAKRVHQFAVCISTRFA